MKKCVFSMVLLGCVFADIAYGGIVSVGNGSKVGYSSNSETFIKQDDKGNLNALGILGKKSVYKGKTTDNDGNARNYSKYYNRDNCPSPKVLAKPIAGNSNFFQECYCPTDWVVPDERQTGVGTPCQEVSPDGPLSFPQVSCKVEFVMDVSGKCVCQTGYYYDDAKGFCQPCSEGHYCVDDEEKVCGSGQYQNKTGQKACEYCASGTKPNSTKTGCDDCSAGTYGDGIGCYNCLSSYCSGSGASGCYDGNPQCPSTYPLLVPNCGSAQTTKVWSLVSGNDKCQGSLPATACYSQGVVCLTGQACVGNGAAGLCKNTVCFGKAFYLN